jgi:septation ring formation regulator EzrA
MTVAIVLVVVAFLVVGVMLSRQTRKTKKSAIADLEAEKEEVGTFDIFELVESEVNALGLLNIEGSTDIPHGVLLKIWSDNEDVVDSCVDHAHLRYVVADGIDPSNATDEEVTLECTKVRPTEEE